MDAGSYLESCWTFCLLRSSLPYSGPNFVLSIYPSGFITAVAVFRKPNAIPLCFSIDLFLNSLLSWLLVLLPSTFFLDVLFFFSLCLFFFSLCLVFFSLCLFFFSLCLFFFSLCHQNCTIFVLFLASLLLSTSSYSKRPKILIFLIADLPCLYLCSCVYFSLSHVYCFTMCVLLSCIL